MAVQQAEERKPAKTDTIRAVSVVAAVCVDAGSELGTLAAVTVEVDEDGLLRTGNAFSIFVMRSGETVNVIPSMSTLTVLSVTQMTLNGPVPFGNSLCD